MHIAQSEIDAVDTVEELVKLYNQAQKADEAYLLKKRTLEANIERDQLELDILIDKFGQNIGQLDACYMIKIAIGEKTIEQGISNE